MLTKAMDASNVQLHPLKQRTLESNLNKLSN